MPKFTVRPAKPQEIKTTLNAEGLLNRPGFHPELCRVGVLDGSIISHALTDRFTLRYGTVRLRTVGLGSVYTTPLYRQHGYARALMRDTLAFMMEQGAHLALLKDTAGYFGQYGFNPVWPEYHMTFEARQAARIAQPLEIGPPQRVDVRGIAHLYEKHWGSRVSFARSPELWIWRVIHDRVQKTFVVRDANDQVAGYISGRDLLSDEVEVVADTPDAAATLIASVGRLYHGAGKSVVRWSIPPDDALVIYARHQIDTVLSAYFQRLTGWMARIIDAPGLVNALLPEISAQAAATYRHFDVNNLVMTCEPASIEIGLTGTPRSFCRLDHQDFIQVMFGTLTPTALGLRDDLPAEAVMLLSALFPPRVGALAPWDWF